MSKKLVRIVGTVMMVVAKIILFNIVAVVDGDACKQHANNKLVKRPFKLQSVKGGS